MAVGAFDSAAYLQLYPDVAEAIAAGTVLSPLQHYLTVGAPEGRTAPTITGGSLAEGEAAVTAFDAQTYLNLYPDAAQAIQAGEYADAVSHFVNAGRDQGYLAPLTNGEYLFMPVSTVPAQNARLFVGGQGDNMITGTDSADAIFGGPGADTIDALGGPDVIYAGNGYNIVSGGGGRDTIYAGNDVNILIGGFNNDLLVGGIGVSAMFGGATHDIIIGGPGLDMAAGGDGNDFLDTGTGPGLHLGGPGADIFNISNDVLTNEVQDSIIALDFTPTEDMLSVQPELLAAIQTVENTQIDLAPVLATVEQTGLITETLPQQLAMVQDGNLVLDTAAPFAALAPDENGQILRDAAAVTLTTGDQLILLGVTAEQLTSMMNGGDMM